MSMATQHGDLVQLGQEVIDEAALLQSVKSAESGAVCSFAGTTRNNFAGREVTRLEYEAYEPLALKAMAALLDEARQLALDGAFSAPSPSTLVNLPADTAPVSSSGRPLLHLVLAHRLGEVPPLQTSIFIAVSSAHRRESFAACEWILEAVKRRVPIWKREWYAGEAEPVIAADGARPVDARWKENFALEDERTLP